MDRVVALKVLSSKVVDSSPDAVKRFQQEVRAAAQLNHTNIVTAHDADQQGNVHYLVMEYVEGEDLDEALKRDGPLPIDRAIDCIVQAAKGLEYAHQKGIIHRDIKPANLLLDKEGTVKILDMGLARMDKTVGDSQSEGNQPSGGLTQSGQIMGTCDYMAPEQAMDTKHATARSDIYSLGCTLYRLLTGNPPYGGDTIMKILMGHQKRPVPSLCDKRPEVPPALEAVYQRMMAKDPARRPQTATELIADLQACLGPGAAARPPKKPPPRRAASPSRAPTPGRQTGQGRRCRKELDPPHRSRRIPSGTPRRQGQLSARPTNRHRERR
jgi:serine/threonine protein kinase